MAKLSKYSKGSQYTIKDKGIMSFSKEDGSEISGRLLKIKKDHNNYLAFMSDGVSPGKYKLGKVDIYVMSTDSWKIEDKISPSLDMGKIYERPITGMAATATGGALAYAGAINGTALGALYGAALISSFGLLGFAPYLFAKGVERGKHLYERFRGRKKTVSQYKGEFQNNAESIIESFESVINPKPDESESRNLSNYGYEPLLSSK